MTLWFEKKKIRLDRDSQDARVKITKAQQEKIVKFRKAGNSLKDIAESFNVSYSLVRFICNPEIYEQSNKKHIKRAKDGRYYDTEKRAKYAAKLREKKRHLLHSDKY